MKNINKVIASALMGVALVSCNDLDTVYEGYYVTSQTKAEVLEITPEMAVAGVTGISANFSRCYGAGFASRTDWDYGYAGAMLGMDHMTADMNARYIGYNHFNGWMGYYGTIITPQSDPSYGIWVYMYNQIYVANTVLASIPADTENSELKMFRAQALGFRSFNYWVLAQMYQYNYVGNQDKPCVPIITEENADVAGAEGAPRASVEEVYTRIITDLTEAIAGTESSDVNIASYVPTKPRRMLFLDALYGLRARAYLTMGKYAEAAADAQKAIAVSSTSPISIEECSKPGFSSMSEHNWMWGIAIAETDRVVTIGIVNNPSMLCSFADGYTNAGCWRAIADDLWNAIPGDDVRKGWWLDDDFNSPILPAERQEYLLSYGKGTIADSDASLVPHTNVKFDSYQSVDEQTVNANDIPLMRIEEMYYIAAEGLAMSNQMTAAVELLTNFEKTYRNPSFVCNASTPEAMQELIWNKRRIELWGEGLAYFDLQRLGKAVNRRQAGCVNVFRYDIPANDPVRIMQIPEDEMQTNPALNQNAPVGSSAGNNEQGSRPVPIQG
ncbi:MAG: RagB/SusD family nutrient uptake outer membrane protein [Muribaculaceae bacterium]|nr:RagB/SusD family nutrient uptake outer membrane protein [Muribaculaceae bacterium]